MAIDPELTSKFNIFAPANKGDIKVGYISTDRGYISGIGVCEANEYAKKDPGTTFIFQTREKVEYMNINGVNKLTPNDLYDQVDSCKGVTMDAKAFGPDGKTEIIFLGGGGVGAKANPVVGSDGSLLAVDMVSGGYGYKYPPIVDVRDTAGIGAGGQVTVGIGSTATVYEVYDKEEDYEEYKLCNTGPDVGYGTRYNTKGKAIGKWDPRQYTDNKGAPFEDVIRDYIDLIRSIKDPWWTTHTEPPLRVTEDGRTTRTFYKVTDHNFREHHKLIGNPVPPGGGWGTFMNSYAISPKPPSNAIGSDFAGKWFTFEWELVFPYDGEYTFLGAKDNRSRFFIDNEWVSDLSNYAEGYVKPFKKDVTAGKHTVRLELFNIPVRKKVLFQEGGLQETTVKEEVTVAVKKKQTQKAGADFIKKADGYYMTVGGNVETEVILKLSYDDDPDKYGTGITKVTVPNPDGKDIVLERKRRGKTWEVKGSVSGRGVFRRSEVGYGPIRFKGDDGSKKLDRRNLAYGPTSSKYGEIDFLDTHGSDANGTLKIIGAVNLQEERFVAGTEKRLVDKTDVKGLVSTETQTLSTVFNTADWINKANRKLWRTNVYARGGFINDNGVSPFSTIETLQDNPYAGSHRIVWRGVNFPVTGNYVITIGVDDNVNLQIGNKVKIRKEGFSNKLESGWPNNALPGNWSTGTTKYVRSIPAGKYDIIADLEQIPGGRFGYDHIKGINPMALAVDIETVYSEKEVVVQKAWNHNPMGVALAIKAPPAPIPQQPLPQQEGRCPPNPFWTTRFPGSKVQWHPVIFTGARWDKLEQLGIKPMFDFDFTYGKVYDIEGPNKHQFGWDVDYQRARAQGYNDSDIRYYLENVFTRRIGRKMRQKLDDPTFGPIPNPNGPIKSTATKSGWSKFFNKYAMSPVPPYERIDTSGGGITFTNSWSIKVPYDGFYKLKAEVDDRCKIWVGGELRMVLDRGDQNKPRAQRKNEIRGESLFFLKKDVETTTDITIEVQNYRFEKMKWIDQKIFNTSDWLTGGAIQKNTKEVNFRVSTGSAFINSLEIVGLFYEQGPKIKGKETPPPVGAIAPSVSFFKEGSSYFLRVEGNDTVEVSLNFEWDDKEDVAGVSVRRLIVQTEGSPLEFLKTTKSKGKSRKTGKFKKGKSYPISFRGRAKGSPDPTIDGRRINLYDSDGSDVNSFLQARNPKNLSDPPTPKPKDDKIQLNVTHTINVEYDKVYEVKVKNVAGASWGQARSPMLLRSKGQHLEVEDHTDMDWTDIVCNCLDPDGLFYDINEKKQTCKFVLKRKGPLGFGSLVGGTERDGVTYQGPRLTNYGHYNRETGVRKADHFISPVHSSPEEIQDKTWFLRWNNVNFPETGKYTLLVESDDQAIVRIDGRQVGISQLTSDQIRASGKWKNNAHPGPQVFSFDVNKGKRNLEIELYNIRIAGSTFRNNPVVVHAKITRKVEIGTGILRSWALNPVGVSAILMPPPCPRTITGTGIVVDPVVTTTGNGYKPPRGPGYPVILKLTSIFITDKGINYDCTKDKFHISIPGADHLFSLCECGPFGTIEKICISSPPTLAPPEYPDIWIESDTGVNFAGVPVFEIVRDPVLVDPDKLIQVTDLAGIKQTGYYEGRAYYGAIYYENGIKYAGYYESPGEPVQIYDTMQESIDAMVTTPPSAILRQGTDIDSDDPRLNIPGTPENLI